jgi:membrane-bound lytic murein transglycosylase D
VRAQEPSGGSLVTQFEFECHEPFPCPDEVRQRANFWMNVFGVWDSTQAAFHDPEEPDRVYSVLDTPNACPRKRQKEAADIRAERGRIRGLLRGIAAKLEARDPQFDPEELRLLALFPEGDAEEILDAAESIRCQNGVRNEFLAGLRRFGAYEPLITAALEKSGIPVDLKYLPFLESSVDPSRVSKDGAVGLWQLMPGAARECDLTVEEVIDQRYDPEASTEAAVCYMKVLHKRIGEEIWKHRGDLQHAWPLTLSGYNGGPNLILRAMRATAPDYLSIQTYKSRKFGNAVRNFYASFLAVHHLAQEAETYFLAWEKERPLEYETFVLPAYASARRLSETLGLPVETLRTYNPSLTARVWAPGRPSETRLVPKGFSLRLPRQEKAWGELVASLERMPPEIVRHTVRRGETLSQIAQRYGVSVRSILRANEKKTDRVRAGELLVIEAASAEIRT